MPTFTYRARTVHGEEQRGKSDAPDIAALGSALHARGLLLIEAKAESEKKGRLNINIPFLNRVPLAERMLTTRHLAVLLEAGVDLPRSLTTLSRQTKTEKFKEVLDAIADDIRGGRRFSESLAEHPKLFSELYVAMIAAGEESGRLVEGLHLLAGQLAKQHELRRRIRGAMMYPSIVVLAMILIGIIMFIYVVPQLESIFGDIGVLLPIQTRIIFWVSGAMLTQWYFFVAGGLLMAYLVSWAWTSQRGKRALAAIFMRVPPFKSLLREIASARFARTFSSLITSGVPIVRALEITARVVGNVYFAASLEEAAQSVTKGTSLHETLAAHPWVFPPLVVEMAAVGEESGKLSEVFEELADFYEGEVDQKTEDMSTIVEPILMLFIGGAVGFFVISLMQPMYSLIGTL